jgi:hypothetical protein
MSLRAALLALSLLALTAPAARAADGDASRLRARLDAGTYAQVAATIDSARAAHLPGGPLIATALEGSSKKAPGPRIVLAVRRHAAALGVARDALDGSASEAELVAGAGALLAGVPPDSLSRLRLARPHESLVVPLVVLADLVARSVPAPAASEAVLAATRAGARDADLLQLRERVERDIRAGTAPAEAARLQSRGFPAGPPSGPSHSPRRGSRLTGEGSHP